LRELPGSVVRGKGFFATFDTSGDHPEVIEWHQVGKQQRLTPQLDTAQQKTTLVAIGLAQLLDPAELNDLATKHFG